MGPKITVKIQSDSIAARCEVHTNWMITLEDFWFSIGSKRYRIPKGFRWNGASIPKAVWNIIGSSSEPDLWVPSLIHDWLYLTHIRSRAVADEVFFLVLGLCDVSMWRRRTMWFFLRTFGGGAWDNGQAEKELIGEMLQILAGRPDSAYWAEEAEYLASAAE